MEKKIIDSIDDHYREELLGGNRLSSYIDHGEYQLLFLRGLSTRSDDIGFNLSCILFKNEKIYIFDKGQGDFHLTSEENRVFNILKSLILTNKGIVQAFSGEIESLEDSLYDRSYPKHFIDIWFGLRKELSKIDRYNARVVDVLHDFFDSQKHSAHLEPVELNELVSSIQYTQSKIKDELSRLDTLHHYFLSIKGDRLNRSLYILTVLSGLFLPLNLIVGFFGMNTQNLFFHNNQNGTFLVVYVLAAVVGVLLFFIPLFKFLDHILLRFFLGRISLYKKLNQKFDKISETFKVE